MNARNNDKARPGRRQEGIAAIEMGLLSFVMAMILLSPIMVARSLMQATLAQRAAYNAVHMLATYPRYERLNTASSPLADAEAMATEALVAGGITPSAIGIIRANCTSSAGCINKTPPTMTSIEISVDVLDPASVLPTLSTVNINNAAADRYAN